MSPDVLWNEVNELRKRDKMRGLPSILSLFRNEFNKINKTGAECKILFIYIKVVLKSYLWRENVRVLPYAFKASFITLPENL